MQQLSENVIPDLEGKKIELAPWFFVSRLILWFIFPNFKQIADLPLSPADTAVKRSDN